MTDFEKIMAPILAHEGGYSNHPKDPGMETYRGISRKFHPNWSGWKHVDEHKKTHGLKRFDIIDSPVLENLVLVFYREKFYEPLNISTLDGEIILNILDFAINAGLRMGKVTAQKVAGTCQDGVIGPVTLAAIDSYPGGPKNFIEEYKSERLKFYKNLAAKDSFMAVFLRGWEKRVNELNLEA